MLDRFLKRSGPQVTVLAPGAKLFNYTAVTTAGVRHRGKMQAPSQASVSETLQADGWIPLSIEEIKQGGVNSDVATILTAKPITLSARQTSTFARQLAELLKAGVPLPRALEALAAEGSPNIQKISSTLVELVSSGVPLSQALETFPKAFDEIFRSYVEAGEAAGTLAITMARLAKTLERRTEMQLKIKSVTAYPKMVSSAIGGIVVLILIYMVPMYAKIYASFGQELPPATVALQTITAKLPPFTFTSNVPFPAVLEGLASPGDIILGLLFSGIFIGGTWLRNRSLGKTVGRVKSYAKYAAAGYLVLFAYDYQVNVPATLFWILLYTGYVSFMTALDSGKLEDVWALRLDKVRFRTPIFGPLIYQSTLHRWTSVLSGALEAGVPLDNAIDLAARTSGSRSHVVASRMIRAQLRNGLPLSEALNGQKNLYPPNIRTMVSTGEQAGELFTMVDNISQAIDGEIDTIIAGLSAKIEVALLVGMGVIVGGLLVVLYLPILQLSVKAGEGMGAF
jgi:type II secretory pathway component PulF